MYHAYVIRSVNYGVLYKGHCQDMEVRLKQHNAGKTRSIAKFVPFEVVVIETFPTLEESIRREKYFKTAAGRRFIKSKLAP
jgi:putative endonuclease